AGNLLINAPLCQDMNVSIGNVLYFPPALSVNSTSSWALTHYLITTTYSINLILGLPTNVYVLWLIVTGAGGTMTSEFFALNLTVCEILYCLSAVLKYLNDYLFDGSLGGGVAFFLGFISTGRPLFQCCICVERYLAVVHPVTFLKYKPLRYRVGLSCLGWMVVLGFSLLNALISTVLSNMAILWLLNLSFWFSIQLFCCLAVLWALKRPGPGEGERQGEGMNNMKLRAFRIISVIMVSMIVMYLPLVWETALCQGTLRKRPFVRGP
ncbi:P2Y purinoceptor 4-like, partial [Salvelinus fontinalis]|uniref:P2Y purinoceptor 4-like n=1 Tax=Salvelinus fontinalis TaxID=8038 RepID=UPI002484F5AB